MKLPITFLALVLMAVSGCAHNPRPESPEQRAERQAQSLQEQQDARTEPRSVDYTARNEVEEEDDAQQTQSSETPSDQAVLAKTRKQAANTRTSLRTITIPTLPATTGVTGSILR